VTVPTIVPPDSIGGFAERRGRPHHAKKEGKTQKRRRDGREERRGNMVRIEKGRVSTHPEILGTRLRHVI